ncbi:MAG TPA: DUF378 domain-containing protein [Methylophilaceae bacterium]|nr:DUF378 domain-containing protein [Methylophilaceae bacterium]
MATITERRHLVDRRASSGTSDTQQTSRRTMSAVDWIAMTLLIIGGINWGLVGLFEFDLVANLFGEMTPISRLVYVLVGLSALYSIYTAFKVGTNHK